MRYDCILTFLLYIPFYVSVTCLLVGQHSEGQHSDTNILADISKHDRV